MDWWRQLLVVVLEGGEFVEETSGGVDLRSREKRWRDGVFIADATCTENIQFSHPHNFNIIRSKLT